jgi:hypothetical protein
LYDVQPRGSAFAALRTIREAGMPKYWLILGMVVLLVAVGLFAAKQGLGIVKVEVGPNGRLTVYRMLRFPN